MAEDSFVKLRNDKRLRCLAVEQHRDVRYRPKADIRFPEVIVAEFEPIRRMCGDHW